MDQTETLVESFKNGRLLFIDKPYQWTSFDVVNKIKTLLRRRLGIAKIKIGHAGTLDPLATGLLIICTGKYTKQIEQFQNLEKTYTGTFYLGKTTPSFDLETQADYEYPTEHINDDLINKAAKKLTGKQEQIPPQYSAKKIKGERAYTFARKGEEAKLKPVAVNITKFTITRIELPEADFEVTCSKGTYIRSLARDFGLELNSGAYLGSLRRTKIGHFHVDDAISIKNIEDLIG